MNDYNVTISKLEATINNDKIIYKQLQSKYNNDMNSLKRSQNEIQSTIQNNEVYFYLYITEYRMKYTNIK